MFKVTINLSLIKESASIKKYFISAMPVYLANKYCSLTWQQFIISALHDAARQFVQHEDSSLKSLALLNPFRCICIYKDENLVSPQSRI